MADKTDILRFLPVAVIAAGLIGSASIGQFQIAANAEDIGDNEAAIAENEDEIEDINRLLIRRQGEVETKLQAIEIEQRSQSEDVDEILLLLQQIRREQVGNRDLR